MEEAADTQLAKKGVAVINHPTPAQWTERPLRRGGRSVWIEEHLRVVNRCVKRYRMHHNAVARFTWRENG